MGDRLTPFYEYHCEQCDHDFEVFVKTMNAAAPTCAACDSPKVTRKLSVFGVATPRTPSPAPGCAGCDRGGACPMAGN